MSEERQKSRQASDHRDQRKAESYPLETIIALQQLLANGIPDATGDKEFFFKPEDEVAAGQASEQWNERQAIQGPSLFAGLNRIREAISEFLGDVAQILKQRFRKTATRSSAQRAS